MLILILFICDSQCMDMLILLICYVTCAGYDFQASLDSMADRVKATFIIDSCYGGEFMVLAHHKVVLYASSKQDEESTGGSLGSLFTNVFVNCVKQNLQTTHQQLINQIQNKYSNHGGQPYSYSRDEEFYYFSIESLLLGSSCLICILF